MVFGWFPWFFKVVAWFLMVFSWLPWFFKVVSWFLMVFGWFPCSPPPSNVGFWPVSMVFQGGFMVFAWFSWLFQGVSRFPWFLVGFHGFSR